MDRNSNENIVRATVSTVTIMKETITFSALKSQSF